ncbi:hypothetical protein [Halorubrum vacuolatum]|uniref:Uncharacterized protein n=1 Tax=Halorubrum vacuolatum TaxID=63740 RepID=A0A238Y9G0_HALVU|nr:hypothetical protein [Halorubrum vacuolatum]SNR67916.1 hypothetical protein SAMN06264855_1355 [Halorubrum vacuolatum]
MVADEPVTVRRVLESERCLQILTHLHEQRLTAAADEVTVNVQELADVLDTLPDRGSGENDGRTAILSKLLRQEWLPAMHATTMIEFDAQTDEVTATPRTTLFHLVIEPDTLKQRDQDAIASACSWLKWRRPFHDPIECNHGRGQTEWHQDDESRSGQDDDS